MVTVLEGIYVKRSVFLLCPSDSLEKDFWAAFKIQFLYSNNSTLRYPFLHILLESILFQLVYTYTPHFLLRTLGKCCAATVRHSLFSQFSVICYLSTTLNHTSLIQLLFTLAVFLQRHCIASSRAKSIIYICRHHACFQRLHSLFVIFIRSFCYLFTYKVICFCFCYHSIFFFLL